MQVPSKAKPESPSGDYYWTEELEQGEEVVLFSRCAYATSRIGAATGFLALTDARIVFMEEGGKGPAKRMSLSYEEVAGCTIGRRLNLAVSLASLNECIVVRDLEGKEHTIWPWGLSVGSQAIFGEIESQRSAAAA